MKWLFHLSTCRRILFCDSPGELRWQALSSACLQGNRNIPSQINLDSSTSINRARSGGFIPPPGVSQAKISVHNAPFCFVCLWNHEGSVWMLLWLGLFEGDGKPACAVAVDVFSLFVEAWKKRSWCWLHMRRDLSIEILRSWLAPAGSMSVYISRLNARGCNHL